DRLRLEDTHPGVDAEVARLPRCGHDGGGVGRVGRDRQRPAAQHGVVLLLDRGEGAVEVDHEGRRVVSVQAERILRHAEQMFAQAGRARTLLFDYGMAGTLGSSSIAASILACDSSMSSSLPAK